MVAVIESEGASQPALVVRLVGPGLDPTAVPVRTLGRILGAVQRLVDQREEVEDGEDTEQVVDGHADLNRVLHLIDVRKGSAAYSVGTARRDLLYEVLQRLRDSIVSPSTSDWLDSTISSIKDLSEIARGLHCEIELREPTNGALGALLASIQSSTYDYVKGSAYVYGETSVYARIERVGGATARHCHIRLTHSPRKLVVCGVDSDDLVRKLGQFIYENVLLSGRARWLRHNWRLKRLEISGFSPPKGGDFPATLRRLHDLGGSAWDQIADPDGFITDMRQE